MFSFSGMDNLTELIIGQNIFFSLQYVSWKLYTRLTNLSPFTYNYLQKLQYWHEIVVINLKMNMNCNINFELII